ncbi:hypothetical protein QR680_016711 [Steinernema hermaphroditum]|nr:hypothetical protein QR680_016711 [Steinernema hermaphroditum]
MDNRRSDSLEGEPEEHHSEAHHQHPHHVKDVAHDPHAFIPFPGHIPPGATASAFVRVNAKDPREMRSHLKHDEKNVKIDK